MEISNLRKLRELEVREQCQIKISKRFAVLESLNDREDINRVCENIKGNISTSAKDSLGLYELKQHKPRFDEECLRFFRSKKMRCLDDPNTSNVDILITVRCEARTHFRNKEKEYFQAQN